MKLSEKLKLLREEKGMTQEQVCLELGIGIQSLRNYENTSIERIPNTVQLKMLKEFYNVTYEYLLDDNCENKTNESVDIGKKLKLSDKAIENIIDIQFINNHIPDELRNGLVLDNISPIIFSNWIENMDLGEFTALLHEYKILNNIIENIQYFSHIQSLENYLNYCLESKKDLKSICSIWDNILNSFKKNLSNSIHSTIADYGYSNLNKEFKKLKTYCKNYDIQSSKKGELHNILTSISSLSNDYLCETERNLKFCLFEITGLIKDNLQESYKCDIETLPDEYKKLITSINKEVKI